MIGCLRTCVRQQPIIALYFESETVLKFYNLEASMLKCLVLGLKLKAAFHQDLHYLLDTSWLLLKSRQ